MVLVFPNSKFPHISLLISVIFFLRWHKKHVVRVLLRQQVPGSCLAIPHHRNQGHELCVEKATDLDIRRDNANDHS